MSIRQTKVSSSIIDRDNSHNLKKIFYRDPKYGVPVWILKKGEGEEEIVSTEFFGYEKDQLKFAPYQNVRFEKRLLRVEGKDGHTILMPNDSGYGFPAGDDYYQILKKIPGELCQNCSYYFDDKFVYVQDVLKVNRFVFSSAYNSVFLFNIHSNIKNIQGGYLLRPNNFIADGYWQDRYVSKEETINGEFVRRKIVINTVNFDKFTEFIFFNGFMLFIR